jgi:hypothetical protein
MASYLDLQNSIADDLTRSDLQSQVKKAIQDAIKQYERSRFWFNQTRSKTFATVIGQTAYGASDLAEIPNIIRIDALYIVRTPNNVYPLDWFEPDEFEVLAGRTTANGTPYAYTYSFDGKILIYPAPVAVYTLRPHMHYRLAALSGDTDTNAWCNEAENLIRAHAKLIMYMGNPLEDDAGAQRMMNQIPGIKAGLDYETSARLATGRIRSSED